MTPNLSLNGKLPSSTTSLVVSVSFSPASQQAGYFNRHGIPFNQVKASDVNNWKKRTRMIQWLETFLLNPCKESSSSCKF